MDMTTLLAVIDEEIKKLEGARRILKGIATSQAKTSPPKKAGGRKRRWLTPEGRARIAEAQHKRWAAKKKAEKKKGKG